MTEKPAEPFTRAAQYPLQPFLGALFAYNLPSLRGLYFHNLSNRWILTGNSYMEDRYPTSCIIHLPFWADELLIAKSDIQKTLKRITRFSGKLRKPYYFYVQL